MPSLLNNFDKFHRKLTWTDDYIKNHLLSLRRRLVKLKITQVIIPHNCCNQTGRILLKTVKPVSWNFFAPAIFCKCFQKYRKPFWSFQLLIFPKLKCEISLKFSMNSFIPKLFKIFYQSRRIHTIPYHTIIGFD